MGKTTVAGCAALVFLGACAQQRTPRPVVEPAPAQHPAPAQYPAPAVVTAPGGTNTAAPAGAVAPPAPPASESQPLEPQKPDRTAQAPSGAPSSAPGTRRAPRESAAGGGASSEATAPKPMPAATAGRSAPPAPTTLDLASLEQRLKDTHAIGVFTKLSLKNQVDDLLAQFKAFHQGQATPTLAELRQRYEVLLLKVVSLLQQGDAQLAAAISSSREAIWAVLVDPVKFSQI